MHVEHRQPWYGDQKDNSREVAVAWIEACPHPFTRRLVNLIYLEPPMAAKKKLPQQNHSSCFIPLSSNNETGQPLVLIHGQGCKSSD